jgi:hypothetical protein
MGMYYAWEITYCPRDYGLVVVRKKKKRKARNEVGEGSEKSDEAEDSNT